MNQGTVTDDNLALAVLRGSLESRCRQATFAATAMLVYTILTGLMLGGSVVLQRLIGWMCLCTGLLLVRFAYARWARRRLDTGLNELKRLDRGFRSISMLSQLAVGAGIWVVESPTIPNSAYIISLFIALYGAGTVINLAHDFLTVKMTLPVLLLQPVAYWLMRGNDGYVIAAILLGLGFMMWSLASNSQRSFNESLHIRFEKDQLLQQLAAEQRATASALAAAEAANRSKSFFMAAASHDLRQPLYAVSILHDALSLHPLGPEPARLLAQQGVAIRTTSALFDNLLDLSKFESGAVQPQFSRVRLTDLLHELEMEFAPQCQARGLHLQITHDAPEVHSDYELLGRLLRNLLSNALRYTQKGGISVQCKVTADSATIAISDTGIGIAPADQERVFGEFVQLGAAERKGDGGTGMGLAIVRHISRLLQHSVELNSAPGEGTTVRVTLPLGAAADVRPAQPMTPPADAPATDIVPLRGRTAWIVEDDPQVRSAVSEYLGGRGCRCISAASHAELKRQLTPGSWPDFVILDDMLGDGESGLDIARQLSDRVPDKRILLTTGSSSPVRWRQLQASGMHVERKPVAAQKLDAWLSQAL